MAAATAPANENGKLLSLAVSTVMVRSALFVVSRTLAPLIGGYLNDNISPRSIWIGGLLFGLTSTLGLTLLNSLTNSRTALQTQPELDSNH